MSCSDCRPLAAGSARSSPPSPSPPPPFSSTVQPIGVATVCMCNVVGLAAAVMCQCTVIHIAIIIVWGAWGWAVGCP